MRHPRPPSSFLQNFRLEFARRCLAATFVAVTAPAAAAGAGGLQPEDQRPVITVTSPANDTIGLPDVRVTAHCTDDQPGCIIRVQVGSTTLAQAVGAIDVVIRPPDGRTYVSVETIDSAGHHVSESRVVYINSTPKLTHAATLPGEIIDIDAGRALIYTGVTLRLVDRATNASQIIWTGGSPWEYFREGFLSPTGAIFSLALWPDGAALREWRNGALVDLGSIAADSLVVKDGWALYAAATYPLPDRTLTVRDLTAGVTTVVTTTAHAGSTRFSATYDVTPDGRVLYSTGAKHATPNEIAEFDPGPPPTDTVVTDTPFRNFYPRSDGINLVYARVLGLTGPTSTVLRTSAGAEVVLATDPELLTLGYLLAGGWIAFTRPDADGHSQLWVRAPDGSERQVSSTGGNVNIEALNEQGEVIYSVGAKDARTPLTRQLWRPDGTTMDLSASIGALEWIDGRWYTRTGPHLWAVGNAPARSILSEGATGTFFTTDVAILNPHQHAVPVTIRYLREHGPEIQETRTLPALSRTTIHENDIAGLEGTSVSTLIEAADGSALVVERLMSWDAAGYGGHLSSAIDSPRPRWLFAEGAQGFFSTFFLLANSGASEATVRFTFLVEQGDPVHHSVKVAPGARLTVSAGDLPLLVNRSFATLIDSDQPIVAERAMYFGGSPLWYGGHGSAGVTEPSTTWYHAEGATGSLFDTFILLANPHGVEVPVTVTYVTDGKLEIQEFKTLAPFSRLTINIKDESPQLANAAVSTRVNSWGYPIVSERAMYWGPPGAWREAHNSFGVTSNGIKWGLAEGRAGGARNYQTYVLVSNHFYEPATLRVTFIREDGIKAERSFEVQKYQRLTIDASAIPELANSSFSTIVESNGVPINVESAIYWSVNGVTWEGGGNTVATRLP